MDSRYEILNGVQEMSSAKNVVADHQMMKGFKYENNGGVDKPDSFVVDLESVSNGIDNGSNNVSTTTTNSRITLQRSLSRKVPQRGVERKINDIDTLAPSSSPRAAQAISTPEKSPTPITIPMGSLDNFVSNQLPQHQITIKTGGMNAIPEGRWGKRSSFKRSPPSWFNDPKRILLFFATLSSIGTMLLIFFTLSMSKHNETDGTLDWQ